MQYTGGGGGGGGWLVGWLVGVQYNDIDLPVYEFPL